jgi:DtxR family manganese transport transcriptional regulator
MTRMVDVKTQARWFNKVREAHQTETTEDYVELIADLIVAQGEARLVDLSARLGVSHATASKVITRLRREGYIESKRYRALFLTEKGSALAQACKVRHELIVQFLEKLGVSQKIAEIDAEGVEHHVSEETLRAFIKFIQS